MWWNNKALDAQTSSTFRNKLLGWRNDNIAGIKIKFNWEISNIIESLSKSGRDSTHEEVWRPATNVVIMRDSSSNNDLMATTCEEYLTRNWGTISSRTTLELLDRFIAATLEKEDGLARGERVSESSVNRTGVLRDSHLWSQAALTMAVLGTGLFMPPLGVIFSAAATAAIAGAATATRAGRAEEEATSILTKLEKGSVVIESKIPHSTGAVIRLSDSAVVLHFPCLRDVQEAIDFVEAWDWLCKALRQGTGDGTRISDASYKFALRGRMNSKKSLYVSSKLNSLPSPVMKHCCWEGLFESCTIVVSSLKPRHEFGKGLEMSFDLMISLAAAEFHLPIAGGVVFVGYRTVLFPTALNGDSAQFHLLTTNDGQVNPYTLEYGSRILTEDVAQFKKMRCFLGWCTNVQVNLGTQKLPISTKYSCGADKGKSIELDGGSAMMQVGASAPLSATLELQSNFKYVSHRLRFTPAKNYIKLLEDTAKDVALVYDSRVRRCWLVPKLSLLLHMSRAYASHCVSLHGGQVPLVAPHSNAIELVDGLKSLGDIPVFDEKNDKYLFRQLMLGLNINLLRAVDLTQHSSGKKLYGFEFMDIVTEPGRGSCMKELKIGFAGKSWVDFANVVDAVVVCADLGDAITAADETSTRNEQCNRVPEGLDCLVATINCLKRLVEKRGAALDGELGAQLLQISENSFWDLAKDPFVICNHNDNSGSCWQRAHIFQHLVSRWDRRWRMLTNKLPVSTEISIPDSGAVVFGTASVQL